jgi:hypothetical protein
MDCGTSCRAEAGGAIAARTEPTCPSLLMSRSRSARSIIPPDGVTPTTLSSATMIRSTHSRMISARITAYPSKRASAMNAPGGRRDFGMGPMLAKPPSRGTLRRVPRDVRCCFATLTCDAAFRRCRAPQTQFQLLNSTSSSENGSTSLVICCPKNTARSPGLIQVRESGRAGAEAARPAPGRQVSGQAPSSESGTETTAERAKARF